MIPQTSTLNIRRQPFNPIKEEKIELANGGYSTKCGPFRIEKISGDFIITDTVKGELVLDKNGVYSGICKISTKGSNGCSVKIHHIHPEIKY